MGALTTTVNVDVLAGSPAAIVLSGCEGVIPAGTSCDVTHTVIDQYGNTMDAAFAGGLSWSTTNGNYSEANMAYTADHVGSWTLSVTSASGAEGSLDIEVGHGEMASLELVASATASPLTMWSTSTRPGLTCAETACPSCCRRATGRASLTGQSSSVSRLSGRPRRVDQDHRSPIRGLHHLGDHLGQRGGHGAPDHGRRFRRRERHGLPTDGR